MSQIIRQRGIAPRDKNLVLGYKIRPPGGRRRTRNCYEGLAKRCAPRNVCAPEAGEEPMPDCS